MEKSLEARFLYTLGPLVIVLAIIMIVGTWNVAETASRQMIRDRLTNLALVTSEGVPNFLGVGQSLITKLAEDPRLYSKNPKELGAILEGDFRTVPFFKQLFVLDSNGYSLAGYPDLTYDNANASLEEQVGIYRAINGVTIQYYSAAPLNNGIAARISFLAAMIDPQGNVHGVLIGRAELAGNPFAEPILANLDSLKEVQGEGILLDENGMILYDQNPGLLMTLYTGRRTETGEFFDEASPDGTRRLVFYQPVRGRAWAIALTVPARQAQQIAITIAAPMSGIVLLISVLGVVYFHFSLRGVTGSLRKLADQAGKISRGNLNFPIETDGEDEVGSLSKAFEQMRQGLKAHLDEQNRLLWVSQGVASSLEISESVYPVLESALVTGACSTRVVLTPEILPELERNAQLPVSYMKGSKSDAYAYLDEQILSLTRKQNRVVLNNPNRPRLLNYPPDAPIPEALLAIALRHENLFYGVMWLAFDTPHKFSREEVRFLATIASHAALAAAKSRHYLNAEVGRQRLEAILNSTPDPVLVTDQQNRLLLANPAALQTLGFGANWQEDKGIEKTISNPELLDLLISPAEEKQTREVMLADGKIYSATTSPVLTEGKSVGRICVLRDVTYFKDLDKLKSEFVSTVSHDLRSPLTLMRGYATMLDMVGELNEQQVSYLRKILNSVESMSQLVSNLLDLGRIEAGVGLQLELIPIRDVLERIVGGLQLEAAQKRIQLSLNVPDQSVLLLEADQALLQQALQNLVENAINFNQAGGHVQVSVRSQPDRMVFEISDTGIGIANVDKPHVFDKFYRVAQPSGKHLGGTGLGLAIVKSIAERHGGETWLESQLGKGSTFFLALPLRQRGSDL
jgi:PAS domain S-box-containing protein